MKRKNVTFKFHFFLNLLKVIGTFYQDQTIYFCIFIQKSNIKTNSDMILTLRHFFEKKLSLQKRTIKIEYAHKKT